LKSHNNKDSNRRLQKKGSERNIAKELAITYNEETRVVGKTLTENTSVKVTSTFLHASIPLNKLDAFRKLFEENGYKLEKNCKMLLDLIQSVRLMLLQKKLRVLCTVDTKLWLNIVWTVT